MTSSLVTGSGGYVGRHTAAALNAAGHRVRGTWRTRKPDLPGVEWVGPIDLETVEWDTLLEGIDVVVHAAGLAHVPPRRAVDDEMFRANATMVGRLAGAAAGKVDRVVVVSSVAAVAETADALVTEDTPCRPAGAYGASKLEGERLLREAVAGTGTTWTILRPPLVYGPGAPGNLARLAGLVATGLPMPFGAVHNRRSFVGIDNLADALLRATTAPQAADRVFMIADDEVVSTADLVRMLAAVMGVPARLVPVPGVALRFLGRAGDAVGALSRRPVPVDTDVIRRLTGSLEIDAAAFRSALDWSPALSLDNGIAAAFGPQAGRGAADP